MFFFIEFAKRSPSETQVVESEEVIASRIRRADRFWRFAAKQEDEGLFFFEKNDEILKKTLHSKIYSPVKQNQIRLRGYKISRIIVRSETATTLDLSENELIEFGEKCHLPNLRVLLIRSNHLTNFNFVQMPHLQKLYLNDNGLESFDCSKFFPFLRILALHDNRLQEFHFEELPCLEELYLSMNKLTSLGPKELPKGTEAPNLRILFVSHNRLTYFDSNFFPNLQHLDISRNRLETFVPGRMPDLAVLNLDCNHNLKILNLTREHVPKLGYASIYATRISEHLFENSK